MPRLQRSWSIVCVEHFSFCWMLFISYFIFPWSLQFSDCMMVVLVLCPTLLYYFDLGIAWSMLCLLAVLYAHNLFNLVDCMIDWSLLFIYATIFREIDLVDCLIAWSLLCQNSIYLCHDFPENRSGDSLNIVFLFMPWFHENRSGDSLNIVFVHWSLTNNIDLS